MGNTIVVRYGRKQTDKLGDGSFDSIELGGDVSLDVEGDENPFELYEQAYKKLAEAIEQKLAEYEPRVIERPEVVSKGPRGVEAPRMDAPPAPAPAAEEKPSGGRGWVEREIAANTAKIQEGMNAMPGERIQPKPEGGGGAMDEYGTPTTGVIVPNEAVAFQKCRVFEVEAKNAKNGNPFVSVRIGKRGEDGIPGQYTTARSFDAQVIKQVAFFDSDEGQWNYKIRDGDFVDVWGYFKPWKDNKDKFDLELQKIQVHED